MADEPSSSSRRLEQLLEENAQLRAEAKDRRIKGKKLADELDTLRKDHESAVKERDSWKGKAEASNPDLVRQVEELKGTIRLGKHRAVFHEKAEAAGIDPKSPEGRQALDDLWTLSGYRAEADEPDPAAIDAAIAGARTARPYLFGTGKAATPAEATPAEKARLQVAVDGTRGGGNLSPTAFRVNSDNLRDLAWMQQNGPKLQAHREAGTLVFE